MKVAILKGKMRRRREKYSIVALFKGKTPFFCQNLSRKIFTLLSSIYTTLPSLGWFARRKYSPNVYRSGCALTRILKKLWIRDKQTVFYTLTNFCQNLSHRNLKHKVFPNRMMQEFSYYLPVFEFRGATLGANFSILVP